MCCEINKLQRKNCKQKIHVVLVGFELTTPQFARQNALNRYTIKQVKILRMFVIYECVHRAAFKTVIYYAIVRGG